MMWACMMCVYDGRVSCTCMMGVSTNYTRLLVHNINIYTVFPRSNAAATIYFITRFTAATIRGRPLIEGGVY